jgi:hypothetical protein
VLFIKIAISFTSLIPCLIPPTDDREKTERTPHQLPAYKKCFLLRLSEKVTQLSEKNDLTAVSQVRDETYGLYAVHIHESFLKVLGSYHSPRATVVSTPSLLVGIHPLMNSPVLGNQQVAVVTQHSCYLRSLLIVAEQPKQHFDDIVAHLALLRPTK